MLPNDVAFSILKNKRAQAKAAAHPDQQNLTQPSPQNNLEGENAGLQSEVSQFIQRLEHKQKELAAREKQREKYEKERQDMMHPDQQTLPQAPALPQPDQDIQQVTQQNQNKFENGLGFKRSILEEMEMLGMIRKDDDDKRRWIEPVKFDTDNPNHPAKTTSTAYDMEGKPIPSRRTFDDGGAECKLCEEGNTMYMSDGSMGCSNEECYANTADFMQGGSDLPQHLRGDPKNLQSQTVGRVEPTQTITTRQDKPPGGGLGGLFPMAPDPDWEPHIKIDAPMGADVRMQTDAHGVPSMQDIRHPDIRTGEPMDIVMRLLKHAESPAAKKHKSEYDTKYESTPDRIKYRTELTQERRKRHVDGKGGKDMSHTSRGTIVPEDMHANRARHFKERGTLKKTVFVKQQCPTPSKKAYSNGEEAYQDASMMGLGVYQCPCGAYHFTSNQ